MKLRRIRVAIPGLNAHVGSVDFGACHRAHCSLKRSMREGLMSQSSMVSQGGLRRIFCLAVVTLALGSPTLFAQTPQASASGDPCRPGGPGPAVGAMAGLSQPISAPDELLALIEIPAGSAIKYELHGASGRIEVDRFLAMPMAYPANYGVFPCTLAGDGDELDVLVLTRAPILPGAVIRVRAIGVLRMIDRGEEDDKILAVPIDAVDATFAPIQDLADLSAAERDRIEAFFRVYKNLPSPSVQVEVGPWAGRDAALTMIRAALERRD